MSQLRRYQRSLIGKRLSTAKVMQRLVKVAGSHEGLKANFEDTLVKTFVQKEVEVLAPLTTV